MKSPLGGVAERQCTGLENRRPQGLKGSNPFPSAPPRHPSGILSLRVVSHLTVPECLAALDGEFLPLRSTPPPIRDFLPTGGLAPNGARMSRCARRRIPSPPIPHPILTLQVLPQLRCRRVSLPHRRSQPRQLDREAEPPRLGIVLAGLHQAGLREVVFSIRSTSPAKSPSATSAVISGLTLK
jgi:hypothetical protein